MGHTNDPDMSDHKGSETINYTTVKYVLRSSYGSNTSCCEDKRVLEGKSLESSDYTILKTAEVSSFLGQHYEYMPIQIY